VWVGAGLDFSFAGVTTGKFEKSKNKGCNLPKISRQNIRQGIIDDSATLRDEKHL